MAYNDLYYSYTMLGGEIVNSDVSTTDMTIYAKFYLLDDTSETAVDISATAIRLFTINKDYSNYEIIKASGLSYNSTTGVTTITVLATYGRDLPKYGAGAGSTTGNAHFIGDEIGCVWNHLPVEVLNRKIAGTEATGTNLFKVGDETDSDIYYYAKNADAAAPFIMYDASENKWVYSNDGASTSEMGGTNTYTGGDGLTITAGDIDIDTTDTTIFKKTSAGAGDENKVPILDAGGKLAVGFINAGTLAAYISDVTSSAAELNKLDNTSANVTATNLNTLTAGSDSDASSLHAHNTETDSFVAGDTVTAGNAVTLIPLYQEWFAQVTTAQRILGSANSTRKLAVKFTPSKNITNLTTGYIRGYEALVSTMTLTVTIETDNSDSPSGTPVTNGTANTIDTSSWTGTTATRTITWASAVSLTKGTAYWLVLSVDKSDAANYLNIDGYNATTETGAMAWDNTGVYDLDTTTWTKHATNYSFFFWTASGQELGAKVVPTDINNVGGWRAFKYVGIAAETKAVNEDVKVYCKKASGLTGLKEGTEYYLTTTPGGISSSLNTAIGTDGSPTTFNLKIGKAKSATELFVYPNSVKRCVIKESTGITSTTTRQYLLGFLPTVIRASMIETAGASGGGSTGIDIYSSGVCSETYSTNAINANLGYVTIATPGTMTVAASGHSEAGVTVTYTETGTSQIRGWLEFEG